MISDIQQRLDGLDWPSISEDMHTQGFAIIKGLIAAEDCEALIHAYNEPAHYRKTVVMERYRFGLGEYKYFRYPLPPLIQQIREQVYPHLAPIANLWMRCLNMDMQYPDTLADLHALCHANAQDKPTVLILKYGQGGHNTLHQDLYGDVFFPMQMVLFLHEPGVDYTGGEFVLTEQVPRAQSKAIVLQPGRGDALIFTTNYRPVKGTKGYYRVNMKHGVSAVHSGQRHSLGIIFHDAIS